ncbi:MAG TPA: T9SS type A sorting domain-containing protein, partial [Bacteroidales bacterium]|nr:T9SS type A sorting domain-containing protein [Bacteroidales bacterium]
AVEVEGVLLGTEASSSLLYTDNNGELRISWYNTTARQLNAGEALVTLKLRVKDLNYLLSESIEISTNAESQLGDVNAQVYENVSLVVPKLTVAVEEYAISNFPNPFNEATQFEYSLPEAGTVSLKVFNMLGEQVSALVNNLPQEAGNYKVEFRAVNLTPGNYTYRFEVQGESRQFSKTGVMVLTR